MLPTEFSSPLAAGIDLQWLRTKAPELARDIVCQLDKASSLAAGYGLTAEQWQALSTSPGFRALVIQAQQEISGPQGVAERIRRKAALMIDQGGLLDLGAVLANPATPGSARVAAFAELREAAGLTAAANKNVTAPGGAAGPLIVINLPGAEPMTVGRVIEGQTS